MNKRLDEEKCQRLFEEYGTPEHVRGHCRAVSDTGYRIALALNRAGMNLDAELVKYAGLIHDLMRVRENHGEEAAKVYGNVRERIAVFRKTLEEHAVLEEFDRYVFESIVEKVIVGGYDEEGNKDPELITFIYKSGFKDSLTSHDFRSPRKSYAARKESYHSSEYEGEDVYQKGSGDTRRDTGTAFQKKA